MCMSGEKKYIGTMFALLLIVLVAACVSPTGNVTGNASGAPELLSIASVSPLNAAQNVEISNSISVTFTKAMDSATINQNTFMVKGSDNVNLKGLITSDATKKSWTFDPADTLKSNSVYTITITTTAKDVSGNSLEKNFVSSFTTTLITSNQTPPPPPNNQTSPPNNQTNQTSSPPAVSISDVSLAEGNSGTKNFAFILTRSGVASGMSSVNFATTNGTAMSPEDYTSKSGTLDFAPGETTKTLNVVVIGDFAAEANETFYVTLSNCLNCSISDTKGTGLIQNDDFSSPPSGLAAVNLGTAGNFVILSKSGISATGTTSITGNIGVSPIDSTAITGFGLIMDSSNEFATSSLVTGKVYAADYAPPTPTTMTTAVSDMETAYTDAAGRTLPDYNDLGAGDISGMTLAPGLYKWGTGVTINTGVTLDCKGNANSVFIFQIAQDLAVANGAIVTLSSGCQAKNIFWQVAGQGTLGTTSNFKGNILSQTAIMLNTGATLNGRALAQTAVTLDANAVIIAG